MITMMKKGKSKSSVTKQSNIKKEQQKNKSPRSALKVKDLNVSSSNVTTSTEASRGCLSFSLSNHHTCSIVSKNVFNHSKSVTANTPKTVKTATRKLGDANLESTGKPTSKIVNKLMKNSMFRSRFDLCDEISSGSELKLCDESGLDSCVRYDGLRLGDADMESKGKPISKIVSKLMKNSKFSSRSDLCDEISSGSELKLCGTGGSLTPVSTFGNGLGLDCCVRYDEGLRLCDEDRICGDNTSPVPPVHVSVSPEIQGGSASVVPATPNTCYGAGHVLSGVSDRRKCKPRGILTIGNNDLFGSCKTNVVENVTVRLSNRKVSLVPSPADASVHWMLSPCDEDKSEGQEEEDGSGLRLSCSELSGYLSSPCSSLGFSSEILNKSYSVMTTSDSTLDSSSSSNSSRSRGLLRPSFDHFVCSPTPSSLVSITTWKLGMSPEERNNLEDSIGSGNVIQTPQSNSSSPKLGLPCMSRDEISRLWFDYELDSVAEVLSRASLSPDCQNPTSDDSPNTSFEFNPLIKPTSSFGFSPFRKAIDSQIPTQISDSLLPQSEGFASYLFEMDELDCCKCFSDDEDNANGCINGDNIDINDEVNFTMKGPDSCQDSPSHIVGRGLFASENYGNKLFQG